MDSFVTNPFRRKRAKLKASSIAEPISLDELPLRCPAVIVSLREELSFLYLLRLGLVVGAEVELVRSVSRGSIKIFRVDSGELALRSESACGIQVRPEPRS